MGIEKTIVAMFLIGAAAGTACGQPGTTKLTASDAAAEAYFGYSIAVSGYVAVVGAPRDDNDNGVEAGAAYVFRFNPFLQMWYEEAKLLAYDGDAYDRFGDAVAVDGETIVIGAYWDDDQGTDSGSAYVFQFDGTDWIPDVEKLLADDGESGDHFGSAISVSGERLLIAAEYDGDNGYHSGSAYIFGPDGDGWVQQAKLLATDGDVNDVFGVSVAIEDDTAIIAAYNDDNENGDDAGSVYVFRYSEMASWGQVDKLMASDGSTGDVFGVSVSLYGEYLVIGAFYDDDNGSNSGSAYVFKYDESSATWVEQQKLLPADGAMEDYFGRSVSIFDDEIVIGAFYDDDTGLNSGSVYVFKYASPVETWFEKAEVSPLNGDVEDGVGEAVANSGDFAISGAWGDDEMGVNAGAVHVYSQRWPSSCPDLNGDGVVDVLDLLAVLGAWGVTCP